MGPGDVRRMRSEIANIGRPVKSSRRRPPHRIFEQRQQREITEGLDLHLGRRETEQLRHGAKARPAHARMAHHASYLLRGHRERGDHDFVDRYLRRKSLEHSAEVMVHLGVGHVSDHPVAETDLAREALHERERRGSVTDDDDGGKVVTAPS